MSIITTTADLAAACKRFAKFEVVTIDTEFMRETTYWPKLCVIQLASWHAWRNINAGSMAFVFVAAKFDKEASSDDA